jgi:hypothetical protein
MGNRYYPYLGAGWANFCGKLVDALTAQTGQDQLGELIVGLVAYAPTRLVRRLRGWLSK